MSPSHLLSKAVCEPAILADLAIPDWEELLPRGRVCGVSGRWYDQLESRDLLGGIAPSIREHLWSDRLLAAENERRLRWEINRVNRAFDGLELSPIVLKGAAYVILGLRPGICRLSSDLDILVPEERLSEAETALRDDGWQLKADDDYDERYYREWMHELPPMRHNVRGSWLDVHHNILPRTSRICPDARRLLEAARPIDGSDCYALCPTDMLIHSIVHGFYAGEFINSFRDILDIHELSCDLPQREVNFWSRFIERVKTLGVTRPSFYALRYAAQVFATPVPPDVLHALSETGPNPLTRCVMDYAVNSTLHTQPNPNLGKRFARRLLLVRSHWLKMPPWMLIKHLSRKYLKRYADKKNPGVA